MDEEQKQRVMVAVLAFNLTVIVMMLLLWIFGQPGYFGTYVTRALISVVVGAVVAGVAYFGVQMAQR